MDDNLFLRTARRLLPSFFLPWGPDNIGTWTPVFAGTGTAGVFTYTAQVGRYTRLGDQVHVHANIAISAITTPPTGTMRITGLPFTSAAGLQYSVRFGYVANFNYAAGAIDLTALVSPAQAYIDLYESFDNAAAQSAPAANFTNAACQLLLSAVYQV